MSSTEKNPNQNPEKQEKKVIKNKKKQQKIMNLADLAKIKVPKEKGERSPSEILSDFNKLRPEVRKIAEKLRSASSRKQRKNISYRNKDIFNKYRNLGFKLDKLGILPKSEKSFEKYIPFHLDSDDTALTKIFDALEGYGEDKKGNVMFPTLSREYFDGLNIEEVEEIKKRSEKYGDLDGVALADSILKSLREKKETKEENPAEILVDTINDAVKKAHEAQAENPEDAQDLKKIQESALFSEDPLERVEGEIKLIEEHIKDLEKQEEAALKALKILEKLKAKRKEEEKGQKANKNKEEVQKPNQVDEYKKEEQKTNNTSSVIKKLQETNENFIKGVIENKQEITQGDKNIETKIDKEFLGKKFHEALIEAKNFYDNRVSEVAQIIGGEKFSKEARDMIILLHGIQFFLENNSSIISRKHSEEIMLLLSRINDNNPLMTKSRFFDSQHKMAESSSRKEQLKNFADMKEHYEIFKEKAFTWLRSIEQLYESLGEIIPRSMVDELYMRSHMFTQYINSLDDLNSFKEFEE